MAKAPAAKAAIILTRPKSQAEVFFTPPGALGFSSFIEPDDFNGDLKFKGNHHYTDEQLELLIEKVQTKVIDPLWPLFLEDLEAAGKDPSKAKKPDARDWIEDRLKQPAENAKIQLPYMNYAVKAEYKDRKTDEMVRRSIKVWDAKDTLLDLASLRMGMGSVVQYVLRPGLFQNALIKCQPNLQLIGVRVLKLEQYGGGQGIQTEALDDAELKTLGDVDVDDLSQYVAGMNKDQKPPKKASRDTSGDDYGDLGDDSPF